MVLRSSLDVAECRDYRRVREHFFESPCYVPGLLELVVVLVVEQIVVVVVPRVHYQVGLVLRSLLQEGLEQLCGQIAIEVSKLSGSVC